MRAWQLTLLMLAIGALLLWASHMAQLNCEQRGGQYNGVTRQCMAPETILD